MGKWLTPQDYNYPATGDTDTHYFIRLFENDNLNDLQNTVNQYLLLIEDPQFPEFAMVSQEHSYHSDIGGPAPKDRYTVMLTLMWRGGPFNFGPP